MTPQIKSYIFSVIIAIHNTARFLDDSIGSLLNQTIGYKEIQIILVNDGSTDNSEEICLKYQKLYLKNVIYIKAKFGGVSKARNIGLSLAKGEFINFLDSDDLWDSKAFEYVLYFFKNNKEINFVSGRLKFFEGRNYYHFLDYKFYKTRIVNLTEEYNCIQSSSSTSFFRFSYIAGKKFEEGVKTGEDIRFINEILLINPIMGLVKEAVYLCRRRVDLTSRTQTQQNDVNFYFSSIKEVSQYLIDKSKAFYKRIVPFIQFYLAYDILFRIEHLSYKYLSSDNYSKYCNIVVDLLQNIEDKYILEQKAVDNKYKIVALSKKYNRDLRYEILFEKDRLKYKDYILINFKVKKTIIWEQIKIIDNKLHLEGTDNLWLPEERYNYFCKIGKQIIYPKIENYSTNDCYSLFGLINKGKNIIFDIPLENLEIQVIYIYISYLNKYSEIVTTQGYFSHIPPLENGYFISGNYIIKMIDKRFTLYKYKHSLEKYFEKKYCKTLRYLGKKNIIQIRRKNKEYKTNKDKIIKNEIWIINDKKKESGDNGEYFFRYLKKKNPIGIDIYFAIEKNSSDFQRLNKLGNVLDLDSKEYLNIFLKSDKLISSVTNRWVDNPFGEDQKYIRDLFHFNLIFIGNGIIKDDLSNELNRINRNIYLFITSTEKEYNSIKKPNYGYNKNNIALIGMPRFDNLEKNKKKIISNNIINNIILIIPTWRKEIKGNKESPIFENIYSNTFKNTQFYHFYNNLINDQRLTKVMKLYNYTGIFCLHHYFSAQWIDFQKNDQFVIKDKCNYQELILESSLLITDYSSIFFDFGYLKKPIIYTQFDYHEYRLEHFPEGYFNYERDGFGPIFNNISSTVSSIIEKIIGNCILEDKYLKRINSFFTFNDEHNNERLFEEIIKRSNIKVKNYENKSKSSFFLFFITIFPFTLKIIKYFKYELFDKEKI